MGGHGAAHGARPGAARRDPAAPALRLPGAQAALRPLHAGDGRRRPAACPPDDFLQVCEAVTANSGRERTTAWVYSVGWTHHTVGVQYIRGSAIIQLLLGNMGRPGGGILALRGHASIQGSTDIPTLFNLLPGYLPMPKAGEHDTLDDYLASDRQPGAEGLLGRRRRLRRQPAQVLLGRRGDRGERLRASTTCRGSPATTAPTRP